MAPGRVPRPTKAVPIGGPRLEGHAAGSSVVVAVLGSAALPARGRRVILVKQVIKATNGADGSAWCRDERELLQREQKKGVPGFLTGAAFIGVFLIWATMIAVVAWGLARLSRTLDSSCHPPPARSPARAPRAGRRPTTA